MNLLKHLFILIIFIIVAYIGRDFIPVFKNANDFSRFLKKAIYLVDLIAKVVGIIKFFILLFNHHDLSEICKSQ